MRWREDEFWNSEGERNRLGGEGTGNEKTKMKKTLPTPSMEPGFSHEEDFDSNGKAKSHYLNSSQSYPVSLTSEKHP